LTFFETVITRLVRVIRLFSMDCTDRPRNSAALAKKKPASGGQRETGFKVWWVSGVYDTIPPLGRLSS
jgi:hypothetical protein